MGRKTTRNHHMKSNLDKAAKVAFELFYLDEFQWEDAPPAEKRRWRRIAAKAAAALATHDPLVELDKWFATGRFCIGTVMRKNKRLVSIDYINNEDELHRFDAPTLKSAIAKFVRRCK
jgi:hypothetical protein